MEYTSLAFQAVLEETVSTKRSGNRLPRGAYVYQEARNVVDNYAVAAAKEKCYCRIPPFRCH